MEEDIPFVLLLTFRVVELSLFSCIRMTKLLFSDFVLNFTVDFGSEGDWPFGGCLLDGLHYCEPEWCFCMTEPGYCRSWDRR